MEFASLIIALFALAVSVSVDRLSIRQDNVHYLDSLWRQVMAAVDSIPEFSDISKTENYLSEFDWEQRLRYDSFCIQAWTACYQLSDSSRKLSLDQRLAIEWMVTYHREWLHGNAQLFHDDKFWKLIEEIESADARLTIHRPVPSAQGLATWDDLLQRYFQTFLSPFDPSISDDRRLETGLGDLLAKHSAGQSAVVVDLGCGIGTAFPLLEAATGSSFHGLDTNPQPLQAAQQATRFNPQLTCGDLRNLPYRSNSIDTSLAINSILMESRADNQQAMTEIARVLKPGGVCIFMLPAFETILHLRQLRTSDATQTGGSTYAGRVERAFNHLRSPDEETASYADDGVTRQYFHSKHTIATEMANAGLEVVEGPTEFYYPWDLTRSYNYGYYPGEKETWDWLLVAKKPEPSAAPE